MGSYDNNNNFDFNTFNPYYDDTIDNQSAANPGELLNSYLTSIHQQGAPAINANTVTTTV